MVLPVPKVTISKADYDMLIALEEDIKHAGFELERAERVGIDVTELKRQLAEAVALRDNILKEYKPSEPPEE